MSDKDEMLGVMLGTRVTTKTRNDIKKYMTETGLFLNMSDFIRQSIREKLEKRYSHLEEDKIREIVRDELRKCKNE